MAIEFHETALVGGAVSAGLFIPGSDLPGITAGEFADAESTAAKTGKLLNGLTKGIVNYIIDNPTVLGLSATKGTPAGAGVGLFNISYQLTVQMALTWASKTFGTLPLATTGANTGYGLLGLKSIFPNAVVLAAAGDIPSEGALIPTADLQAYGGPASISGVETTDDNRDVIASIFRWMGGNTDLLQATGNQTALISQLVGTPSSFTPAPTLYAATNPESALTEPLNQYTFMQLSPSVTLQYLIEDNTEVNV